MFEKLKVGPRVIGGFLVLNMLSVILAVIGIQNLGKVSLMADSLYGQELMGVSHLGKVNADLAEARRTQAGQLLAASDDERALQGRRHAEYLRKLKASLEQAKPLFLTDRAQELLTSFSKTLDAFEQSSDRVTALAAAEKPQQRGAARKQALAEAMKHAESLDAMLGELSGVKEARARAAADEIGATYRSNLNMMVVLVALGVVAGMTLGVLISRSVTRPLDEAVRVARTVAAGDLTSDIRTDAKDELGELLTALKDMNTSLVGIVGQVRSGTDTMATASRQIASGNMDLSSRTEQQAASLEETASSMEQLTATVRQNGDNARQGNTLAQSASAIAIRGGTVVSQVVDTMGAINESARKIADIISIIDSIAFQTNILALNAAVEAARAGEQGRGFAVVASEVRTLAQRSAAAAREIKLLIGDSVAKVDAGTRLVDEAGNTMLEIVASIQRVTDIMGEIAAASREQTVGIEQVNHAIVQMDEVTQQNAALVEEAAAAAQSLQDQASSLSQVVAVFQVGTRMPAGPGSTPAVPYRRKPGAHSPAGRPVRKIAAARAGSGEEWKEF